MADKSCDTNGRRSFWQRLKNPPSCSLWQMILIGIVGGIGIWGALNTGMEWTNRTEFCISCHEMTIPYEDLKKTIHYKNRAGVSVSCADCHVASSKNPIDYGRKLTMKLLAARDIIGHISGVVDTPEKFEAHRLEMAQRVWARMKETDSRECRNCHKFETMDKTKQKDRSVVKHEGAIEDGKTCIDCHKGIVHRPVHQLLEKGKPGEVAPVAAPAAEAPKAEEAKVAAPVAPAAVPAAAAPAPGKAEAATKPDAAPKIEPAPKAEAAKPAAGGSIPALDWSKAPMRQIKVFYPGQAALEWVMNKPDHSSAADITEKKRACAKCHEGDAGDIGEAIIAGKPVGVSKTVMEPTPPSGKAGFVPVGFQATHDGTNVYFRFEWQAQKAADAKKMDPKNEVKLTMMFDGGGTVPGSEINGCWATCHNDLRTMKEAKDEKKTKYIPGADLASGKFMDLIQFKSGKGEKPVDGYVADSRQMQGGKGLVAVEGKKEGNKWVVIFARKLAGGGKGDHVIEPGKTYYFGFAVHEDYSLARYHFVSLGYQFGLDKVVEGVKNYYNVVKQ